jgi:hypothetical protein
MPFLPFLGAKIYAYTVYIYIYKMIYVQICLDPILNCVIILYPAAYIICIHKLDMVSPGFADGANHPRIWDTQPI